MDRDEVISSSLWKQLQENWHEGDLLGYNLPPELDVAPDGWNLSGDDKLFQQNLDHLLTHASEEYDNEPERTDEDDVDKIFVVASQQFESTSASNERFEKPTSSADIRDLIRSGIPDKTQKTTSRALRVWREWVVCGRNNRLVPLQA